MPIKKRSQMPTADQLVIGEKPAKLNIVAKPKKPIPDEGVVHGMYGDVPRAPNLRRLGLIALACDSDTADDGLSVQDRVALMRTPYDANNPQELRYRGRVRNRGTAITAMCITCQGGRKAVTECISTTCPLWAWRFSTDPFYGRRDK